MRARACEQEAQLAAKGVVDVARTELAGVQAKLAEASEVLKAADGRVQELTARLKEAKATVRQGRGRGAVHPRRTAGRGAGAGTRRRGIEEEGAGQRMGGGGRGCLCA